MKLEKAEAIFFVLNLLASLFVAWATVKLQTSKDVEKLRSEQTFQGKIEAVKMERDRTARKNEIQKLTEKVELLTVRFRTDSTLASDSIDFICHKRIDSVKQSWASRGGYEGISGGKTLFEMELNRIKSKCNQEKASWALSLRRQIDDLLFEVKWLKNLDVTDTLPIPAPSL